jgi:hypothetical protein
MSGEQKSSEITSLHLDVKTRRLMTVLEDQTALQFTLTPDLKLLYDGHFKAPASADAVTREAVVHGVEAPPPPSTTEQGPKSPEKQPIQTLSGRITQDVQPGRVDGRGNPTSWTIAAVHEEGNDQAKMVAVSFHRHATQLALDHLHQGDQITVQGYLRPAALPKPGEKARLDNFSAFHLINYPGKPPRTQNQVTQ